MQSFCQVNSSHESKVVGQYLIYFFFMTYSSLGVGNCDLLFGFGHHFHLCFSLQKLEGRNQEGIAWVSEERGRIYIDMAKTHFVFCRDINNFHKLSILCDVCTVLLALTSPVKFLSLTLLATCLKGLFQDRNSHLTP